jgi:TolA-binding protein
MRVLALFLILSLQGCGMYRSFTEDTPLPEATLADLQPISLPQKGEELPAKSLDELAELYRAVLPLTSDPQIRISVNHRLADIEMISDEDKLAEHGPSADLFLGAIAAYKLLLQENPNSAEADQYLYQLSKAYELNGDNEKSLAVLAQLSNAYPKSWYYAESEFRRAESHFVAGDYVRAEAGYARVSAAGDNSIFYGKSLYMEGWSRFKQNQYQRAVAPFTASLDALMPEHGNIEVLQRSQREQLDDTFRILAVIFSYLGGADAVTAAYSQLGSRDYQYLVYQSLGDLYLTQERYRDSAETYKAYIVDSPDSQVAHTFQLKVIAAYEQGSFPELVVSEKQFYVALFEPRNENWLRANWSTRNAIDEQLQQFIPELAQHYHAMAQLTLTESKDKELAETQFASAARYYKLYVASFPKSEQVPYMAFLLGESQYESGDYRAAIESYEWVAYRFTQYERSADAAFSAIATYARIPASPDEFDNTALANNRIDSELRFARVFFDDPRASAVLGQAASDLFALGDYRQAARTADTLVHLEPSPPIEILSPAWLVMGHSYFELADYPGAEAAYLGALAVMKKTDKRYDDTYELVAASVYKQGETAANRGRYAKAADEFARVLLVAPTSKIRMNAQFDAAQNYTKAGDTDAANALLKDFRTRYPDSALTASIPAVLVANYEKSGSWNEAARELDVIYTSETDPEKQREALYLAAQYYDKTKDSELAILRYRSYAHAYEQPFGIRLEAMSRLAQLYADDDDAQKQYFWLTKIMNTHDAGGSDKTDRSLFLAASSSNILADEAYYDFIGRDLTIPLKASLKRKKSAMDKAVRAYNKTNGYAVEQFSTLATYRLARIYQKLASALLSSERPPKLDELALEQYELLLEEQAFPFEEKAIAIHQTNAQRSWDGVYDEWVKESFSALAKLMPGRYAKSEKKAPLIEDIY